MVNSCFSLLLGFLTLAASPALAQFGSASLSEAPASAPSSMAEPLSEFTEAVGSDPFVSPAESYSAPAPVAYQPPPQPVAPIVPTVGKKWLRHETGYTIMVDADVTPGPGFQEVAAPVQQPVAQAPQAWSAPQATAGPAPSQPQTFQSIPTTGPSYSPPSPSTGAVERKKWMQHKSGYRVVVSASTNPGPDFVEIPPPAGASMSPQPPSYQPVQSYQQPQSYSPQVAQTAPQTFSAIPATPQTGQQQLSNLPPNYQRQLPYQPPTPQGVQLPQMPARSTPTYGGYQTPGASPASPAVPPGKKYITDQQGMRYLVSADAVVGAGFRELTPEEATQPTRIMVTPQMMQQMQQQGGGGGMPQQGMMMQQGGRMPQQQGMMMQQPQQQQAPANPLSGMFNFLRR